MFYLLFLCLSLVFGRIAQCDVSSLNLALKIYIYAYVKPKPSAKLRGGSSFYK